LGDNTNCPDVRTIAEEQAQIRKMPAALGRWLARAAIAAEMNMAAGMSSWRD